MKFLEGKTFGVEVLREQSDVVDFLEVIQKKESKCLTSVVRPDPLVVAHLKTVEYSRNVNIPESVFIAAENKIN